MENDKNKGAQYCPWRYCIHLHSSYLSTIKCKVSQCGIYRVPKTWSILSKFQTQTIYSKRGKTQKETKCSESIMSFLLMHYIGQSKISKTITKHFCTFLFLCMRVFARAAFKFQGPHLSMTAATSQSKVTAHICFHLLYFIGKCLTLCTG